MRPDVVANILANVENEWRTQAAEFIAGSASASKAAPGSFAKSCSTVVSSVVQGSGGDRKVAKEYMNQVCSQKVLEGWHKSRCVALAASITDHAMLADSYANRQNLNSKKVCTGFWSIFVESEKNREAEEAKVRAEQEKVRAEEEKKAAVAKAEALKKAEAEAKIEAEHRAKEQAKRDIVEKEEKAKRDAVEAKARAAEASARLAQKKAEAAKLQKEAQDKLKEAEKAEEEHTARLAEHKKAEEVLQNAQAAKPVEDKPVPVLAKASTETPAVKTAAKEVAVSPPKPEAKKVAEDTAPKVAVKAVVAAKAAPQKADSTPVKVVKAVAFLKQDPCAGCTEGLSQSYQSCAMKHGNPCAETNSAGLVTSGPGTKKDIGCCMKKEKHDRCLECKGMDCAHGTCKVNKKYYSSRTIVGKMDDKAAMKKSGWGK